MKGIESAAGWVNPRVTETLYYYVGRAAAFTLGDLLIFEAFQNTLREK